MAEDFKTFKIQTMAFVSKKRKVAESKIDAKKSYSLKEASALVKQINTTKFDASVDLHIRLGVDPKKADQAIRGTVTLPHGTGKTKKVLVLCTPDKEAEAKAAGADYVGLDEFVTKIEGGWVDVDVIIATYFEGAPQGLIAQRLGISARAVEGRLYRARALLRSKLQRFDDPPA